MIGAKSRISDRAARQTSQPSGFFVRERRSGFVPQNAGRAGCAQASCSSLCYNPGHNTIAGFYTLSQHAIELDVPADLARKLPKYELVPATLLGRLAVSINFRGRGLGRKLLLDALYRCLQSSRQVASTTVIVDARDDEARAFYRKYGFIELPKVERRLLLPMATIEALFGE